MTRKPTAAYSRRASARDDPPSDYQVIYVLLLLLVVVVVVGQEGRKEGTPFLSSPLPRNTLLRRRRGQDYCELVGWLPLSLSLKVAALMLYTRAGASSGWVYNDAACARERRKRSSRSEGLYSLRRPRRLALCDETTTTTVVVVAVKKARLESSNAHVVDPPSLGSSSSAATAASSTTSSSSSSFEGVVAAVLPHTRHFCYWSARNFALQWRQVS